MDKINFINSVPYFSGLTQTELDAIAALFFEKNGEKNEVLTLEGQPAETLYFVASGVVKVFKTSAEGKEQILSLVRPGGSLNEIAIFDGGPSPTSAEAITPVVLYGISGVDLILKIQTYPKIAQSIIKVLAGQVRQLMSLIEDLAFKRVISRVANILLEHVINGGDKQPRLTQQEMAAMAGTAREVVGRSLKTLEDNGVLRIDRHRIIITNKEGLKELAQIS